MSRDYRPLVSQFKRQLATVFDELFLNWPMEELLPADGEARRRVVTGCMGFGTLIKVAEAAELHVEVTLYRHDGSVVGQVRT